MSCSELGETPVKQTLCEILQISARQVGAIPLGELVLRKFPFGA